MRKTLLQRCQSTLKSLKARARKDGAVVEFTAEDLVSRVGTHCPWCGDRLVPSKLNLDHEIPVARGGSYALENLRGCCGRCNRRKGALTSHEYRLFLRHMQELAEELQDPYAVKNILMRLAAGGAFIYHR